MQNGNETKKKWYSESKNKTNEKYKQKHIKRVPLEMQLDDYAVLKDAAVRANSPVNTYIKQAIKEKIERDFPSDQEENESK